MQADVQRLIDTQAITDVLMLYSRGIDRRDEAALMRVYWEDAIDDHGEYSGPAHAFIKSVMPTLAQMKTSHMLANILIEFASTTVAQVETYFQATHVLGNEPQLSHWILGGRYLDRFEKRAEEWRIKERTVVVDYQRLLADVQPWSGWQPRTQALCAAKPNDPVYRVFAPGAFPLPGGKPFPR